MFSITDDSPAVIGSNTDIERKMNEKLGGKIQNSHGIVHRELFYGKRRSCHCA
jgi:hypothetical protein